MSRYYEISEDGTLIRKNRFCPRCGPGYFMADMYNRDVCGNCGFTDFKKKPDKKRATKAPVEKKVKKEKETKGAKKRKKK
ncbi:MAG: 30S ribosomal protein S27ae [Candidatus Lokiarchaeota archaeon]|nr:30S ribosomal protein S27ae [Candidatus Lokiarchaeota archaeon]